MVQSTNAVPTPFKADFSLDLPMLASHVDRWANDGLYGERKASTRFVRQALPAQLLNSSKQSSPIPAMA